MKCFATVYKGLIVTCTVLLGGIVPAVIVATPAFAGCTLPDGSTNGVLINAGKTCCPPGTQNSETSCLFGKYINPLIQLLSLSVGLVVVIGIIYGAIEYITSSGDPQKAANGKKRIMNSMIGLVAFLLLFALLQFLIPGGIV